MPNLALNWSQAAIFGTVLLALGVALRLTVPRAPRILAPLVREAGLLAVLYAMWQLAGSLSLGRSAGAYMRARWIVATEHDWHLPSEVHVQDLVTPHARLTQLCNLYYASMHFTVLFVFLLWMFLRHRSRYGHWRTTIVLVTASCLLIQLVPVAPPRLLPEYGFVDTAQQYGQSVYTAFGAVGADEFSAMPSVHVAWAALIAVAVWTLTTSRWRWLGIMHGLATVFIVVATANHFWLDGIVAVALLGLALAAQAGTNRLWREFTVRRRRASAVDAIPAAATVD
jgi:PAP2 superfamily